MGWYHEWHFSTLHIVIWPILKIKMIDLWKNRPCNIWWRSDECAWEWWWTFVSVIVFCLRNTALSSAWNLTAAPVFTPHLIAGIYWTDWASCHIKPDYSQCFWEEQRTSQMDDCVLPKTQNLLTQSHHCLRPTGNHSETLKFIVCFQLLLGKQWRGVFTHNVDLLAHVTAPSISCHCVLCQTGANEVGDWAHCLTRSVQHIDKNIQKFSPFLCDDRCIPALKMKLSELGFLSLLFALQYSNN